MKKEPGLFLCPGAIGAAVRVGASSSGPKTKMGDNILIDLENRFFAVADGADRSPDASYYFLKKALEMFKNWSEPRTNTAMGPERIRRVVFKLETQINEIMAETPFNQNCTFTGVLVLRGANEYWLAAAHTGDSRLFRFFPGEGLSEISKSNFWLVGKSNRLYQMEMFPCRPNEVFFLITDGMDGLIFPESETAATALAKLIGSRPVEDLPGLILDKFDQREGPKDDLGFLFLKPDGLPVCDAKFIFMNNREVMPDCLKCRGNQRGC